MTTLELAGHITKVLETQEQVAECLLRISEALQAIRARQETLDARQELIVKCLDVHGFHLPTS